MIEFSLIFYGKPEDFKSPLLKKFDFIEFQPAMADFRGLYISENRFGKKILTSLSIDFDQQAEAWLVFRYLHPDEIEKIKLNKSKKIYLLAHNLISMDYVNNALAGQDDSVTVLTQFDHAQIRSPFAKEVKSQFKSISQIKKEKKAEVGGAKNQIGYLNYLFSLVSTVIKLILSPISELNRYSILLKYSNLRVAKRSVELILFLDFIFRFAVLIPLQFLGLKFFWLLVRISGAHRVYLIKSGYFINHIFKMTLVKLGDLYRAIRHAVLWVYGRLVDLFFILEKFSKFVYYKIILFLYYRVIHYIYSRLIYYLYYRLVYFLYYRVLYYLYYKVMYYLYYRIKHALLISYYKITGFIYGRSVDAGLFIHRIFKLYLLYPFFKIYWFLSFQYKKRIKKTIR
ncbi:MAG: hypothetical protein ACXWQQ_12630 [Pseudobdellovibrio sp.]